MGLIELIIIIAVIGFITWIVTTMIPMPALIKQIIIAVVVIILLLYVVRLLIGDIPIGKI